MYVNETPWGCLPSLSAAPGHHARGVPVGRPLRDHRPALAPLSHLVQLLGRKEFDPHPPPEKPWLVRPRVGRWSQVEGDGDAWLVWLRPRCRRMQCAAWQNEQHPLLVVKAPASLRQHVAPEDCAAALGGHREVSLEWPVVQVPVQRIRMLAICAKHVDPAHDVEWLRWDCRQDLREVVTRYLRAVKVLFTRRDAAEIAACRLPDEPLESTDHGHCVGFGEDVVLVVTSRRGVVRAARLVLPVANRQLHPLLLLMQQVCGQSVHIELLFVSHLDREGHAMEVVGAPAIIGRVRPQVPHRCE
mmetsp:Transcript_66330/g.181920  ORF Transcript_66330/g.181920 Transcript_66330/m.181920 type:complete len:301 (+) Transcript_66330:123-1025(+)